LKKKEKEAIALKGAAEEALVKTKAELVLSQYEVKQVGGKAKANCSSPYKMEYSLN